MAPFPDSPGQMAATGKNCIHLTPIKLSFKPHNIHLLHLTQPILNRLALAGQSFEPAQLRGLSACCHYVCTQYQSVKFREVSIQLSFIYAHLPRSILDPMLVQIPHVVFMHMVLTAHALWKGPFTPCTVL